MKTTQSGISVQPNARVCERYAVAKTIFNPDCPLDISKTKNQMVVGRVSPKGCENLFEVTRQVGLKPDLQSNELFGFKALLAAILALLASPSFALNIFACEPEWAALATELAADKADIYSATTALQDPHQIQARPSLIAKARRAQLVVCTGSELEVGWLPVILRESGNADIEPGKPGNFEATHYVTMLEVPSRLDRAEGDVHPGGNPHIQTGARNFLPVAQALSQRMTELDPANAAFYRSRLQNFTQRWQAAIARWEKQAAPLKGVAIIAHHKDFAYLNDWLGLNEVAELEPKPGMEPSVAHMTKVLEQLQRQPAKMVVRSAYQNSRPSEWMSEHAHIPIVVLPFSVGGTDGAKDLFGLFDDTIQRLLEGLK